jgi:hypothetical protein
MFLCVLFTYPDNGFPQQSKHAAVKVVFDGLCSVSAVLISHICLSLWPRSLSLGSAAARLLGLRDRIPPGTWISVVSVVCCEVEFSVSGWSLVQGLLCVWVWSWSLENEEVLALGKKVGFKKIYPPPPSATTCPLWTSWSPLPFVAEV